MINDYKSIHKYYNGKRSGVTNYEDIWRKTLKIVHNESRLYKDKTTNKALNKYAYKITSIIFTD